MGFFDENLTFELSSFMQNPYLRIVKRMSALLLKSTPRPSESRSAQKTIEARARED